MTEDDVREAERRSPEMQRAVPLMKPMPNDAALAREPPEVLRHI